jgi:hypothetical protein
VLLTALLLLLHELVLLRVVVAAVLGGVATGPAAARHSEAQPLGGCDASSTCHKHGLLP